MNPLLAMFLAQAGGEVLSRIMPGNNSAYQKTIGNQMSYGERLLPELFRESMGKPSAATKQAYRNLSNEANKLQQSYSASMTRANPTATTTTTPVREQQGRYGEAKLRGYADILSQGQTNAQNAIMDMYSGAQRGQMGIEAQNRMDKQNVMGSLSGLVNEYRKMKTNMAGDPQASIYANLLQRLVALLGGGDQQGIMPTQTGQSGFTPASSDIYNIL